MTAMFLVSGTFVSAQGSEQSELIKEVVEKSRSFGGSWQNDQRNTYQYDIFGREIQKQFWLWDELEEIWIIGSEDYGEYDNDGNRTLIQNIVYSEYPEKLNERVETREYQDGLVQFRKITIRDFTEDSNSSLRVFDVYYKDNFETQFLDFAFYL